METKLFLLCDSLRNSMGVDEPLAGRALYGPFYEPSFLTHTSFERAMSLMGGQVQIAEAASCNGDHRLAGYRQAENGLFVRMALLRLLPGSR